MFSRAFLSSNAGPDGRAFSGHTPMPQRGAVQESDELEREGTAELQNDPRFFAENVIEKRLAAFEGIAIVTELLSTEAVEQCFTLTKEFSWTGKMFHVAIIQIVGFSLMVSTMFLASVATAVLSLQLFYTIRLFTAGPTGFDKAARFYQDTDMWRWRERAIFGVKWGLVTFFMATGCMLYVKFYTEGAPAIENLADRAKEKEYNMHKVLASAVFGAFTLLSFTLLCLVCQHHRVFRESSLDSCVNELSRHLILHTRP